MHSANVSPYFCWKIVVLSPRSQIMIDSIHGRRMSGPPWPRPCRRNCMTLAVKLFFTLGWRCYHGYYQGYMVRLSSMHAQVGRHSRSPRDHYSCSVTMNTVFSVHQLILLFSLLNLSSPRKVAVEEVKVSAGAQQSAKTTALNQPAKWRRISRCLQEDEQKRNVQLSQTYPVVEGKSDIRPRAPTALSQKELLSFSADRET